MDLRGVKDFSELISLLKASKRRGSFSYNELAARLAFRSPRSIAMVHKNQRSPSLAMIRKISDYVNATAEEQEFLFLLAEHSKLTIRKLPIDQIEARIAVFRQTRRRTLMNAKLPGVIIAVDEHAPEKLRQILETFLAGLSESKEICL